MQKKSLDTNDKKRVLFEESENGKDITQSFQLKKNADLVKTASKFARIEASTSSSTPLGSFRKTQSSKESEEQWPGPFATAWQIMQQRDEAKAARESQIAALKDGHIQEIADDDLDMYDKELKQLKWKPTFISSDTSNIKRGRPNKDARVREREAGPLPSLMSLCCRRIVKVFNPITDEELPLDMITIEARDKLATELSSQRKLSSCNSFLMLACYGSQSINFPECSSLEPDFFTRSVLKVTTPPDADNMNERKPNDSESIRILKLRNCGHGLTDQVAASISPHIEQLQIAELTGCYKLTDVGLKKILQSTSHNLQSLDLSCNSRLSSVGLSIICEECVNLRHLTLDHAIQINDDDLKCILPTYTPENTSLRSPLKNGLFKLESLSLAGLVELTDESIIMILNHYGHNLALINFSGCLKLTDESIKAIRQNCTKLTRINLSNLPEVSTIALIGLFVHEDNYTSMNSFISSSIGSSIHSISLSQNVSVTDDVIIKIIEQYSHTLEYFYINSCYTITSKSMIALAHAGLLKELDISFLRLLSEDAVGHLVDQCIHLTKINVWGCTQLTKRFFE
eukprot:gene11954-16001_t